MKSFFVFLLICFAIVVAYNSIEDVIELVNNGDYSKASVIIESYIDKNPNDHKGFFIKASILTAEKKYEAALSSISKAISLNKSNAEYYRMKGQILEQLQKPSNAILAWKNCLKYSTNPALSKDAKKHLEHLKAN